MGRSRCVSALADSPVVKRSFMCASAAIAGSATVPQSAGRPPADNNTVPLLPSIRTRIVANDFTPRGNTGTGRSSAPTLKKK